MMVLRLTLVLTFLLVASSTVFADCRERVPTERTIRVKVLKWKTYENGQNWNAFFVETLNVCDPKTGVNHAFLVPCVSAADMPDGCPPVKNGQTYDARFAANQLTSISVDNKRFRTPSTVLMPCVVPAPAEWEGVRTALRDGVRCVASGTMSTVAAAPPTPTAGPGLVGTVWEAQTPQGANVYLRFEPDRKVFIADSILLNNVIKHGIWSQDGEKVSLDFLDFFMVTKLTGDQLTGEIMSPVTQVRKPWSAKKMK